MKCFTFHQHQLLEGLDVTRLPDRDVVFLGQYSKPGFERSYARNIGFDYESPAEIVEVRESSRIAQNLCNMHEPAISFKTVRIIKEAVPWIIRNSERKHIVLKKPLHKISKQCVLRVNTSSSSDETNRNGFWKHISGYQKVHCHTTGHLHGFDKKVVSSWVDDLITLYPGQSILVGVQGTSEIDDQVITNDGGELGMAPASMYVSTRLRVIPETAEEKQFDMEEALSQLQLD